jgi:hypothetical protein
MAMRIPIRVKIIAMSEDSLFKPARIPVASAAIQFSPVKSISINSDDRSLTPLPKG